ncbi:MAG: hypothetical protein LBM99_02040 [Bacillales bacterium]|jgi:hypothetical protein|nr:hypothetical protein [Bacillales bacterium]
MIYSILGLKVQLELEDKEFINKRLSAYKSSSSSFDISIKTVINNDIKEEEGIIIVNKDNYKIIENEKGKIIIRYKNKEVIAEKIISNNNQVNIEYINHYNKFLTVNEREYLLVGNAFMSLVLKYGFVRFHASCLRYKKEAVLFIADSGTGKSTHTNLWQKLFKEDVTYINDDKPFLKIDNGLIKAYGSPWSGKSDLNNNINAPVRAVVILNRGQENIINKIQGKSQIFNIMKNINKYQSSQPEADLAFSIYQEIFKRVDIYELYCNISDEAVLIVKNELFK